MNTDNIGRTKNISFKKHKTRAHNFKDISNKHNKFQHFASINLQGN